MKDYNKPTYIKDCDQRKFNGAADLTLAISGTAACVYISWLIGCAIFNAIIFNI